MSVAELADGSENPLGSALVPVQLVSHRKEAVAGLPAHLRAGATAAAIATALFGGPGQSAGLSGNDVRCRVSAVSSCVLSAVVCVMTGEDQLGWSRYLPRVLKLPHSERTPMSARRQSPRPHGCQPITCANAAGARDAGHLAVYANSSMWWRELLGLLLEIVGSQGRLEVTGPTSFGLVCESRCAIREAAASLR